MVESGLARIGINASSQNDLLGVVEDRLRTGQGFAVATVNLDHVVKLRRDAEFRSVYLRHDFIVADGNPIVWLSRLARRSVELVPGADVIEPMVRIAAGLGVPVALFGSSPEALAGAEAALTERVPALKVVARISPPQGFEVATAAATDQIDALERSGARLVFVALGAPRQERFAIRCRARMPRTGFVSIGAGLDFLADRQRRAPSWMRRLALEWLWRLMSDPRRLGWRYARCAAVLPGLVLGALGQRYRGAQAPKPAAPPPAPTGKTAAALHPPH